MDDDQLDPVAPDEEDEELGEDGLPKGIPVGDEEDEESEESDMM